MVGFGSSLRLARRPGWEGAYLDYESLKLLLTQIETVYEEAERADHVVVVVDPEDHHQRRDFRDELFLESDSDVAYLSPGGEPDMETRVAAEPNVVLVPSSTQAQRHHRYNPSNDNFYEYGAPNSSNLAADVMEQSHTPGRPQRSQFTLHYSRESSPTSSEGETGEDTGCGTGYLLSSWSSDKHHKANSNANNLLLEKSDSKRRRSKGSVIPGDEDDAFYPNAGSDAFILASTGDLDRDLEHQQQQQEIPPQSQHSETAQVGGSSILSAPVRHTFSEDTLLLAQPVTPGSSLFSFTTATTPPTKNRPIIDPLHPDNADPSALSVPRLGGGMNVAKAVSGKTTGSSNNKNATPKDRRQEQRRRRRLKKRQRQIKRKVPQHLRVAHAKARAITERFLGLLRAETEKVMLFCQARLGELADTAGSLRFPSFDDDYVVAAHQQPRNNNYSDYPLSDGGGMHPSASSSSDEGATHQSSVRRMRSGTTGGSLYPWSDSSDEEETTSVEQSHHHLRGSASSSITDALSSGAYHPEAETTGQSAARITHGPNNRSASPNHLHYRSANTTESSRRADLDSIAAIRRQMKHFTTLRQNRGTFQRSDQILGEDMLFLSAVEEADGYTAVGVELMHVLRYICVNLIAVRKICRKHDRLLMNRMLGGYYQRARRQDDRDGHTYSYAFGTDTLGGRVARASGDVYEAHHPALIRQMNHYKLVGVYDRKIQRLANSRTVQVISSCLALALSEYEMSNSRANAITRLNSRTSLTPKRSGGGAKTSGDVRTERQDVNEGCSDDELSTASKLSLTRLQFTVTSIHALREAAQEKQNLFGEYLSRSSLAFSGRAVIGEGLDGCARETLDFLVAFQPDAALLLETSVLFQGLRRGLWKEFTMRDLMLSTLATSMTAENVPHDVVPQLLSNEEAVLAYAINVDNRSTGFVSCLRSPRASQPFRKSNVVAGFPPEVLQMSRTTYFLFMVRLILMQFVKCCERLVLGLNSLPRVVLDELLCGACHV